MLLGRSSASTLLNDCAQVAAVSRGRPTTIVNGWHNRCEGTWRAQDLSSLTQRRTGAVVREWPDCTVAGGDEETAELVVSAPVDEMVHAVLAQYTLCQHMTQRLGIRFVHMTDRERFGWQPGDYTSRCYAAAGWGEPPARYWIAAGETRRRLRVLNDKYTSIGIFDDGRRHTIDFDVDRVGEPMPVN